MVDVEGSCWIDLGWFFCVVREVGKYVALEGDLRKATLVQISTVTDTRPGIAIHEPWEILASAELVQCGPDDTYRSIHSTSLRASIGDLGVALSGNGQRVPSGR